VILILVVVIVGIVGVVQLARALEPSQRVVLVAVFLLGVAYAIVKLTDLGLLGRRTTRDQTPTGHSQSVSTEANPHTAQWHLERGESLSSNKNYAGAIAEYSLAIQLDPTFAQAYNDRGFAHYLRKDDAKLAIADFTRAIELRPNYPKAFNSRGVMYMSNGYDSSLAIADFDQAIALKPDFRYAYINRANALLKRHPWLALSDFHRAGMHPEWKAMGGAAVLLAIGFLVTYWLRAKVNIDARRVSEWVRGFRGK
jgi:Flp pilus assembly protein TadD